MAFGLLRGMKKQPWPGKREYIGSLIGAGGKIDLYMPSLGDIEDLEKVAAAIREERNVEFATILCAAACNISIQEFIDLPYQDASEIIVLVLAAQNRLKPLVVNDREENRGAGTNLGDKVIDKYLEDEQERIRNNR